MARLRERLEPAHLAVGPAVAALQAERLARRLAGDLALEDLVQVVGVQPRAPVQHQGLVIADARELDIGGVDEDPHAVLAADPHQGGGAVGQGAEPGLALAQALLGKAALGDLEIDPVDAQGAAGLVAHHLPAPVDPPLAARMSDSRYSTS
jgi:hypothetical protein